MRTRLAPIAVLCFCLLCSTALSESDTESNMSFLDNGEIRLGVDLSIGGSVTYLADSTKRENVINSHDWGRQVQMSFYSGPVPFIPEGKTVRDSWKFLGWNPIQSGDCFGNRSKILEHRNDGKEIYVRCIPMHWPAKNVPGQCTFECWYRLEGRAVCVRSRLNNNRDDKTQYAGRHQEQPAIYTNGPYHHLFTYDGAEPFSDGPMREIQNNNPESGSGIRWAHWTATESWAALVNDKNWGVGIWSHEPIRFCGGFYGKRGTGGTKDGATGYIAPLDQGILDHNIQYEYQYTLILDSLDNIRKFVYAHAKRPALPKYCFDTGRMHWIYRNAHDTGLPIQGGLNIIADGPKMSLQGPDTFWIAKPSHILKVKATLDALDRGEKINANVYWKTLSDPTFNQTRKMSVTFQNDGKSHVYRFPLEKAAGYEGAITGLRLDPITPSQSGDRFRLESVVIE
jgi:hypothetical protein